ncbi:GNAT family N-acetyltransferase [Oceanobacillus sp. CFH 90083]|uniref:GNAT family N-acetyltransferase n=1 Tax=Oceanobacillus sp. CFH 90083 TaxID=2592336 RepID=UPI00128B66C5|nr:GNAT family N-acetyltransferase [Oceanobacillus sp. CFH 90083]
MLFQNGKLTVRELEQKDNHFLAKWLSDPYVLQFYEGRDNPFHLQKVNEKFYTPQEDLIRCLIKFENMEIGYIQFYQLDKSMRENYGYPNDEEVIYGMDQFIGETKYWNKGIGETLIKSMVDYLVNKRHADKVVMDPQTWNKRALRCYEKCGFKKIKLLPEHELHEGEYRDSWLIEYQKPE